MKEAYYWDLIARSLNGKTSPSDEAELKLWIGQSHENEQFYQLQKKLWEHTEAPETIDFETSGQWLKLQARITAEPKREVISFYGYLKIAASVVILISAGILLYNLFKTTPEKFITTVSTDRPLMVVLPDNSQVWLNKHSSVRYPEKFETSSRKIQFEGEAFFEITKDKARPFTIQAETTVVEVVGTSFNVRARKTEKEITVSVVTGQVAFYTPESQSNKLMLIPGLSGVFTKANELFAVSENGNNNFLAWKDGTLDFHESTMTDVFKMLEKSYDITIVRDNPSIDSCRITTKFNNQSLTRVLKELRLLTAFEYKIQRDTVTITGGNCN